MCLCLFGLGLQLCLSYRVCVCSGHVLVILQLFFIKPEGFFVFGLYSCILAFEEHYMHCIGTKFVRSCAVHSANQSAVASWPLKNHALYFRAASDPFLCCASPDTNNIIFKEDNVQFKVN